MNQENKRTPQDVMHDIKKGVNQNIYSQYKISILGSLFLTTLIFILSLVIALTSFTSITIMLIISFLSILMALILWRLHKKINLQEQISIQNIQKEMKNFYSESDK